MANDSQSRVKRHEQEKNKSRKPKKTKDPHQKKKLSLGSKLLRVLLGLMILGCIGLLSGMGLFWYYAKDAPTLDEKKLDAANSSVLYAANGEAFADLGSESREKIDAKDVPQLLEDAIVSVEDHRFYKHIGVDPIRIAGSALSNFTKGGLQGGSTLTQQLIKLSFFSTKASDQTLKRKAQEAWLALQLEQKKSKQEILTYYINKVYMSNGLYGMETASEAYFDKPLKELDLAQTALLAGMPQAPTYYDPYQQPENLKVRRDTVLLTMLNNKKITQSEYEKAKAEPIDHGLVKQKNTSESWKYYDNYIKEVISEVKAKTGKNVNTDGLKIYTNLDVNAQKRLYEIVNSDKYVEYPDKDMQVASTMVDVKTGKVTAQIGARNVPDNVVLGQNLAVGTGRDFGSTVKPITDYGPAFQYLQLSTATRIDDQKYYYKGTDIELKNWDNSYMGNITLRTALEQSRNVPAAKLFDEVGADDVKKFLNGLGIDYKQIVQANAVSSNTEQDGTKYGVSSLKMAAAYAALANGGTYYKPQYVNKIVYQDGSSDEFKPEGKKAMDAGTAYMVTDILKDVISQGTGTNAIIDGLVQAGKTGTSNYDDNELEKIGQTEGIYPDISFVGYTPRYAISVWTGYNKKMTPITEEFTHVASDVYRELMKYVSADKDVVDWKMPKDLIRVGSELYWRDKYNQQITPSFTYNSYSSTSSTQSSTTSSTENSSTSSETESSSVPESSSVAPPPSSSSSSESSVPPVTSETPPSSTQESSTPPATSESNNNAGG